MGKMTQWDYALLLLPFADGVREEDLLQMSRGALATWIERTKRVRLKTLNRAYGDASDDLQKTGDILAIAKDLTTLKSQGTRSPWHCGPCPKCKGVDRFFVSTRTNWFECRQCANFKGGLVTLAAHAWGCTTWDAIDQLTGQSFRDEPVKIRRIRKPQQAPQQAPQESYRDYSGVMAGAKRALLGTSGQGARHYLATERGLQAVTWERHEVGLTNCYGRQAVAFGHRVGKKIVGLNQRKIGTLVEGEPKSMFMKGHKWGLFHLERWEGAGVLIVVEGEINGLSIWQVARLRGLAVDVVSVGSEGAFKKLSDEISRLARKGGYTGVLIWADKKEIAVSARQGLRFGGHVIAIQSPAGLDANDLLLRGQLADFVAHYVATMLQQKPARQQGKQGKQGQLQVERQQEKQGQLSVSPEHPLDTTINYGAHLEDWAKKAIDFFDAGNHLMAVEALEKVEHYATWSELFNQFDKAGVNMMLGAGKGANQNQADDFDYHSTPQNPYGW